MQHRMYGEFEFALPAEIVKMVVGSHNDALLDLKAASEEPTVFLFETQTGSITASVPIESVTGDFAKALADALFVAEQEIDACLPDFYRESPEAMRVQVTHIERMADFLLAGAGALGKTDDDPEDGDLAGVGSN